MVVDRLPTLDQLTGGEFVRVRRVSDVDATLLQEYRRFGLRPRAAVEVLAVEPGNGPVVVRVAGAVRRLTRQAAAGVFVEVLE